MASKRSIEVVSLARGETEIAPIVHDCPEDWGDSDISTQQPDADAIFDEASRQAHLNGPIAQALGANVPSLLARTPSIERIDNFWRQIARLKLARKPR